MQKHYLVIKRFEMDDVPVMLTTNKAKAEKLEEKIQAKINSKSGLHATMNEQRLMGCDITLPCAAVTIIEFNEQGKPVLP